MASLGAPAYLSGRSQRKELLRIVVRQTSTGHQLQPTGPRQWLGFPCATWGMYLILSVMVQALPDNQQVDRVGIGVGRGLTG